MIDFRLLKKPFTFRKYAYAINCGSVENRRRIPRFSIFPRDLANVNE